MLFDVSSLFTKVLLDEFIAICADTLYNIPDSQPCIPKEAFMELLHSEFSGTVAHMSICGTERLHSVELLHRKSTVEFSFDNIIYRQIDGVAMGSPLGPALANIFVGYYEKKRFSEISKPAVYFRYVDDTFVIFQNGKESEEFLIRLNSLHLLVHRALTIWSKSKLKEEINRIKEILLDNGYPENFVLKYPRRSRSFHAPSDLALISVQSSSGSPTLARWH